MVDFRKKPDFKEAGYHISDLFKGLWGALGPTTVLIIAGVVLIGSLSWVADPFGWFESDETKAVREENAKLQKQLDKAKDDATYSEIEANQHKKAFEALQKENKVLVQEKKEIIDEGKKLAQETQAISDQIDKIRRDGVRVPGTIRQRVDRLGSKLDELYPDTR